MPLNFTDLRSKYPDFIYEKFSYEVKNNELIITFYFNIPTLQEFKPTLILKNFKYYDLEDECLKNIIFHIGLVEVMSYVKCTCSPNIIIKAGFLNEEQIKWWQKLYYNGLGEFLYRNNINVTMAELFNFKILGKPFIYKKDFPSFTGNLIPVGGGKDSALVLELLKDEENNNPFILNPKSANLNCVKVASLEDETLIAKRTIDPNLLALNQKGFLNGHTPFSALLSFITYLVSYLNHKKYIILANESSANEATVLGTNINHQYSKSFQYEKDFNNYMAKYFGCDIHYFSLLRPLSEYNIAKLFSKYTKYHLAFRSCNVNSKKDNWDWCCSCPKCLFVYIILSPFLTDDELFKIFKTNMYDKKNLLDIFLELLGYKETKPFECVGTYDEVRYAVSKAILKRDKLPFLLLYYKNHYPLELNKNYYTYYDNENNVPDYFQQLLKKELEKND